MRLLDRPCFGFKSDHKFCLSDELCYLQILREHHFDMERVERALRLYGL